MLRYLLSVLAMAGVLMVVGAQEPAPPGEEEQPLRLKKKPAPGPEPKEAKGQEGEKKEPGPGEEPEEKLKPAVPEESEEVVVERIIANMKRSEEKLQKQELDEGIRQTHKDILKDLDSLIALAQKQQDQAQNQQDQNQSNSAGGGKQPQDKKNPQGSGKQAGQRQPGSKPGMGSRPGGQQPGSRQGRRTPPQSTQNNPRPGGNGQNPGAGGTGETGPKDRTADLYKDTWGHLRPGLRAEMNAYSNPRPFMPKYDDLIKRYYRTIAAQGRRQGD
jgi:hypothetical protein